MSILQTAVRRQRHAWAHQQIHTQDPLLAQAGRARMSQVRVTGSSISRRFESTRSEEKTHVR